MNNPQNTIPTHVVWAIVNKLGGRVEITSGDFIDPKQEMQIKKSQVDGSVEMTTNQYEGEKTAVIAPSGLYVLDGDHRDVEPSLYEEHATSLNTFRRAIRRGAYLIQIGGS